MATAGKPVTVINTTIGWCRQSPGEPAVCQQVHEQDAQASRATPLQVEQQRPVTTAQAEAIVRTWQVSQQLPSAVSLQFAAIALSSIAYSCMLGIIIASCSGFKLLQLSS